MEKHLFLRSSHHRTNKLVTIDINKERQSEKNQKEITQKKKQGV